MDPHRTVHICLDFDGNVFLCDESDTEDMQARTLDHVGELRIYKVGEYDYQYQFDVDLDPHPFS